MNTPEPLAYLCRWLEFLAVLVFAGNVLFRTTVFSTDAVRRFDIRLYRTALAVLTLTTPLGLLLLAAQFAEGSVGELFRMLPKFVMETHVGRMWLLKAVALLLGWAGFLVYRARGSSALCRGISPVAGLWVLTLTLSSHSVDEGMLSLAMAADIVHVTAAAAWIGGLLPLVYTLRLADNQSQDETARPAFVSILERFSTLATVSVGAILLSGGYMAWLRLPAAPSLPDNAYGHALLLKLGLVAVILGLGGLNKLFLLPRLKLSAMREKQGGAETMAESLRQRTLIFLAAEASLATAVLGCAALLAQSSADM